jgi:surface polysaccharide O-acyltransferase-like enzyme
MTPKERGEPMRDARGRQDRDTFIDAVRVVAVLVVVTAHVATTTVIWEPGRIGTENALSTIPGTHPATWLLQVMPLLFFAGGFANARSLARHDGEYLPYVRTRLHRLLAPTLAFMAAWLVVGIVAEPLPLPQPNVVERAADLAALPLWFLGLYVVVVALAPTMWRLHRRWGWWVPVLLAIGALAVDVVVHCAGFETVGVANYAFVWLLPHQLGYLYGDGKLERVAGSFVAAGLIGLVGLVTVGGYPVSMVGVPGEDRWNTDPPSLALVALSLWLIGLALSARSWIGRKSEQVRPLVSRLNATTLTLYLWHVTALALAAAVIYPLGFPRPEVGTARWWALRPLWLLALVPFVAALVLAFRRFEVHPAPRPMPHLGRLRTRAAATAIAVVSLALGILGFGVSGFDHVAGDWSEEVLAFSVNPLQNLLHVAVGLGVLEAAYARSSAAAAPLVASALYVALGIAGWSAGIGVLAMNSATAILHVVVGGLGFGALGGAAIADRRSSREKAPRPIGSEPR